MLTLTNVTIGGVLIRMFRPTEVRTRGSLRSRGAATVSSLTVRQISAVLPPEQPWGLWAGRQIIANIMNTFGPSLADTDVETVDVGLPDGRRVVGEWVRGAGVVATPESSEGCIYYLHGSGYAMCSPRTHRRLISWLSRLTDLPVFCVDYRLAPRHRFPAAADDVRAGWDWLQSRYGFAPERMVIAGDSAGGHLAVDLMLQPDVAQPAGAVLMSPLVDMTFGLSRAREALRRDPAIRADDALRLVNLYCGTTDITHPRLTLNVAGGRALPPTLVQAGGGEMLVTDARRLAADIRAAGGTCELQVWPDQVHVFQALPRLSPEARPAMYSAANFIADALRNGTVHEATG
jgi:epsilon-lactone hydrolase